MKHTIEVTREDITLGAPSHPYLCPVGRALYRKLGEKWYVNQACAQTDPEQPDYRVVDFPAQVIRFILSFDLRVKELEPFSFDLEVPESEISH